MIHNRVTSCQRFMTANRGKEKSAYFKLSQTTQNMGSNSEGSSKGDFGLSYTVDMFWQQHKKTGAEEWAAHNEPLTKSWCELQHGLWAQVAPAQMKEILHCMATSFCPWWLLCCTENNYSQNQREMRILNFSKRWIKNCSSENETARRELKSWLCDAAQFSVPSYWIISIKLYKVCYSFTDFKSKRNHV